MIITLYFAIVIEVIVVEDLCLSLNDEICTANYLYYFILIYITNNSQGVVRFQTEFPVYPKLPSAIESKALHSPTF